MSLVGVCITDDRLKLALFMHIDFMLICDFCLTDSVTILESHGAMLVPVISGMDKTTVSVATGQNDYHLVYMSLGNFQNSVRQAHLDAVLPVAFLAIPKGKLY
jgi:hypothetical protein